MPSNNQPSKKRVAILIENGVEDAEFQVHSNTVRFVQEAMEPVRTASGGTLPGADGCWGNVCEADYWRCCEDVSFCLTNRRGR